MDDISCTYKLVQEVQGDKEQHTVDLQVIKCYVQSLFSRVKWSSFWSPRIGDECCRYGAIILYSNGLGDFFFAKWKAKLLTKVNPKSSSKITDNVRYDIGSTKELRTLLHVSLTITNYPNLLLKESLHIIWS